MLKWALLTARWQWNVKRWMTYSSLDAIWRNCRRRGGRRRSGEVEEDIVDRSLLSAIHRVELIALHRIFGHLLVQHLLLAKVHHVLMMMMTSHRHRLELLQIELLPLLLARHRLLLWLSLAAEQTETSCLRLDFTIEFAVKVLQTWLRPGENVLHRRLMMMLRRLKRIVVEWRWWRGDATLTFAQLDGLMFDDCGLAAAVIAISTATTIVNHCQNLRLSIHHNEARIMMCKKKVLLDGSAHQAAVGVVELIGQRGWSFGWRAIKSFHSLEGWATLSQLAPFSRQAWRCCVWEEEECCY